jgi:protease I
MQDRPLEGKKIAILVESEFIPEEIEAYRRDFAALGAEVHFMSYLWGQPKLTFTSAEQPGSKRLTLEVDIDFQDINPDEYAAIIMAANYTSVRLRYFEPPPGQPFSTDMVKSAPAVKFFARAMANRRVVKGALCHGLWILTPNPEMLKGRKVICHEVVLADVLNCGAEYIPPDTENTGVVIDEDLVTGRSRHEVLPFIEAIAKQIRAISQKEDKSV